MQIETIPAYLREAKLFCLWKRKWNSDKGAFDKVPYNTAGYPTDSGDRSIYDTYSKKVQLLERRPDKFTGVGVGMFDDLVGIDIDHCVEDGKLLPEAQAVVEQIGSYAELSPSGTGVHILCRAPGLNYDKAKYYAKRENAVAGVADLEVYVGGYTSRFLTFTGNVLVQSDVEERTEEVAELLEKYMRRDKPHRKGRGVPPPVRSSASADSLMLDDAEVIARMLNPAHADYPKVAHLWDGGTDLHDRDKSDADCALCTKIIFYGGYDIDADQVDRIFRQSGRMRDKWDEARGAETYSSMTIASAFRLQGDDRWSPDYRSAGEVETSDGVERAVEFLRSVDAFHNARYSPDDIGSGYLLADYMRPFARPVPELKGWRIYDGKRWKVDTGGVAVAGAARDLSRALAVYSTDLRDKEMQQCLSWSGRWARSNNRKTYLQEAASVHTVSESDFDRDIWLLNLNNGTLDLCTGELRPHDPDDLITKLAPVDYDPTAVCSRWESFIREIMEPGDSEELGSGIDKGQAQEQKAQFLQRYLGYGLSGDTREESFLIMYGPTSRNGKSVCVEVVRAVLGDYAKTAQAETLMVTGRKDGRGPSEDVARLAGARMVSVGELPQGGSMDTSVVKQLTGRDAVTARFLGQNSFTFVPHFKILLHTNYLPKCQDLACFDSGRVLVLPFSRHFEEWEQDKGLKDEFRKPENLSAVLNWLLRGLKDYREQGLNPPPAVRAAVASYRKDSDKISRFVEDALTESAEAEVRTSLVYEAYQNWCRVNGHIAENTRSFTRGLERAGLTTQRKRPRGSSDGATTMLIGYELSIDYVA